MSKILKNILFISGFLSLLFILLFCFLLWPWGDDMFFIHELRNQSVIQYSILASKFDIRMLTPIAILRNFILLIPHSLALIIYNLVFFWSTYLILFKIFKIEFTDKKEKFIFFSFFTLIIFYGLNKVTSEVLFWQAGAYYTLNLFFGLLWLISFNKVNSEKATTKTIILYILLSILAGTFTYNLSVALVTYAILIYTINKFKNYKKTIIGVIFIIIITFILILLPGALTRTSYEELSTFQKILGVFRAFLHVPKNYFSHSYTLLILLALFSITYYFYNPKKKTVDIKIHNFRSLIKYLIFSIIAFSTIAPFIVAPQLASLRTALYFMIFGSIFVLSFYNDILTRILNLKIPFKNLSGIIILFFFIFHIFIFSDHYYIAYDLRKQHNKRHNFLIHKAKEKKDYVEIKPYNFQFIPFTLQYLKKAEPTNKPNDFRNVYYQTCYGIDTVIIK